MKKGDKIGDWQILKLAPTRNRKKYWEVQCLCGKISEVSDYALKKGKTSSCRECYIKNRKNNISVAINDTYFNYKVIGIDKSSKGKTKIKIQCKCGYITTKNLGMHFSAKQCKSCYNKSQKGKKSSNRKGYEGITGSYWSALKKGAAQRGLKFSLTKTQAWDLFLRQDKKCALSGLPLILSYTEKNASLDRIDSSIGYVEGNVQWTLIELNYMKYRLTQERFLELCKAVVNTHT